MQQHHFHECPLRSSSLILIYKQSQAIATVTDEVCQYLGYTDPHQLVGKPIQLLNPRPLQSGMYLLQCHDDSEKLFRLCVHHDSFNANASHLEYWLLNPFCTSHPEERRPLSVLRLSSYGTVDYAYLSREFPQTLDEIDGHPIMSYIHPSDVVTLCEKLKQCRIYNTFQIRWLNKHPKHHNHASDDLGFIWVSFTVIHASSARKSMQYDPQTAPLCILRPVLNPDTTTNSTMKDVALQLILRHFRNTFIKAAHFIIRKTCMMECFAFVISFVLIIVSQIIESISENHQNIKSILLTHVLLAHEFIDNCISSTRAITKKQ